MDILDLQNKRFMNERNFYFSLALSEMFYYKLNSILIWKDERYFFCLNDNGQFINEYGVFNTLIDLLNVSLDDNDLEKIKRITPLENIKIKQEESFRYYRLIKEVFNENKRTISFETYNDFEFLKLNTCKIEILNNIDKYTSDNNIKYFSRNLKITDDKAFDNNDTVRLLYMSKDKVMTVIDINDKEEKIKIKNFTDKIVFRAFGINESPDWNNYQEFLEDRCVSRTRYNIDEILKDMGMTEYNPFEFVKRTQGRMADDKEWILLGDTSYILEKDE